MKKILSLVLAAMMFMALAPGFASAESAELSKVLYVVPGSAPAAYDTIMAKVNESLAAEGIQLEVQYIPWDVWDQKINLMLSTGDPFDLFQVMQDRVSYATYYSRGGLMDISKYIDEFGSAITATIPQNVMEAAYIGEGCYIVPANWIELGVEGTLQTNKYLLDKYGKELPATPAEMLDTLEAIIAEYDGAETPYLTFRGGTYDPTSLHSTVLHSTYDSFPFTVKESIIKVDQDGTISSWFESEEFKKDADFMHEAYTRGLIDPDVLSITQEQISDLIQRGIYVFSFGCSDAYTITKKEFPDIDKDGVIAWRFNPEKGSVRPWAFKNGNAVPSTSTNPEGAVKFLNWLYSSQENYDLFFYGIEGVNYTIPEEGKIAKAALDSSDPSYWSFSEWMAGNMALERTSTEAFTSLIEAQYTTSDNAQNSIAGGFFFDASEVQAEYSNVLTELAAVISPIALGVQEYDAAFPAALERLKAAGLDTVVEAYKTQFAAYQESLK